MAWFPVGMARICEAARLLRITPNELRHTCATQLNDDGAARTDCRHARPHHNSDASASLPAPGPTVCRRGGPDHRRDVRGE